MTPDSTDTALGTPGGEALSTAIGWQAFGDVDLLLRIAAVLAIATATSALFAYHPAIRRKVATLDELEQPKTLILYGVVGAVVALIVRIDPNMALVVFGIGGLLRFRTDVGAAQDTGRVILVTVIGLCAGLQLFTVVALTTLLGWVLIYVLEQRRAGQLVLQGLDRDNMSETAAAYTQALSASGCRIIGQRKNVKKGTVTLVFRVTDAWTPEAAEQGFAALPDLASRTYDWELP